MRKGLVLSIAVLSFLLTSCEVIVLNGHVVKPPLLRKISPTYCNAKLVTNTNKLYEGKLILPKAHSKTIKIKTDSAKIKLSSNEVNYFYAWHKKAEESKAVKFIYSPFRSYLDKGETDETKISKNKSWMIQTNDYKQIEVYTITDEYFLFKDGYSAGYSDGGAVSADIWLFFQRKDEEMPTVVMLDRNSAINTNMLFVKYGVKYFKDCPPLVEKIKSKEFTNRNIEKTLEFYDQWKSAGN